MKIKIVQVKDWFGRKTYSREAERPESPRLMLYVRGHGFFVSGSKKKGFEFSHHAYHAEIFRGLSPIKNSDVYKTFGEDVLIYRAEISWDLVGYEKANID